MLLSRAPKQGVIWRLVVIALVDCFLGALLQAIVSEKPFKTPQNFDKTIVVNGEDKPDASDETVSEDKAERGEKNFHKAVQVVKVAEHSFGRL